ncbi:hypothetical protein GCM10027057_07540 [Marisediminicola antarctica]
MIVNAPDRKALLRDWIAQEPQVMAEATAEVDVFLGELANDLGVTDAAIHFIDRALERGISPRGYWKVRLLAMRGADDADEIVAYLDDVVEHPLAAAQVAHLKVGASAAFAVLESWTPDDPGERAFRLVQLASHSFSNQDWDNAIKFGREAHVEFRSASGGIIAARALTARQLSGRSNMRTDDLSDALTLALESRDDLRSWRYDSSAAVAVAATIAEALDDSQLAIRLSLASPDGDATPEESRSPAVRINAAIFLAKNGSNSMAEELLLADDLTESERHQLRAQLAFGRGDEAAALSELVRAVDTNDDWEVKGRITARLAMHGHKHDFVEIQRDLGNTEFSDDLTFMAAVFANDEIAIADLKARAHAEPKWGSMLSRWYQRQGDVGAQISTLVSVAKRTDDADLWLSAAKLEERRQNFSKTVEYVRAALSSAPKAWGGEWKAFVLLAESQSNLGDWDGATKSAQNLLRIRPDDPASVWALIACQLNIGNSAEALSAWSTLPGSRLPKTRSDVVSWIKLLQEFKSAVASPEEIREVSIAWEADEPIRVALVGYLLLGSDRTPKDPAIGVSGADSENADTAAVSFPVAASDPDQEAAAEVIHAYFRDFPQGSIIQVSVDMDDIIGSLSRASESFGPAVDTKEFDASIWSGQFPIGAYIIAHRHTYAEVIIGHASGVRFAGGNIDADLVHVESAFASRVIVDTTAAYSLGVLPPAVRALALSRFSQLIVATAQVRDAGDAKRSLSALGLPGGLSAGYRGPVSQRSVGAKSRAQAIVEADRLVAFMSALTRDHFSGPPQIELSEVDGEVTAWLAAGELSLAGGILWSDDIRLNGVIAEKGGRTITTLAVVAHLLKDGTISETDADLAASALIAERYVEIPFDKAIYAAALTAYPDRYIDVAAVIENLSGRMANDVIDFMLDAAGRIALDHATLEMWLSALFRWLTRVSPTEAALGQNILAVSRRIVTGATWLTAATFPSVHSAIVDGLSGNAVEEMPLVAAVREAHSMIRLRTNPTKAAMWVFDLVAGLEPADRVPYRAFVMAP